MDCFSDADRETEKAATIGTAAAFSTEMTVLDKTNPKSPIRNPTPSSTRLEYRVGIVPASHDGARGCVRHRLCLFHWADIGLVGALTRTEPEAQQQASEYPKVLHDGIVYWVNHAERPRNIRNAEGTAQTMEGSLA